MIASVTTAALPGAAVEMGDEGLEKVVAWVVGLYLLCRWWECPGWTRENAPAVRANGILAQI
jgi:hypothetical protein